MADLRDKVMIAAPASVVWAITADLMDWPSWNPNVTAVEALDAPELAPGARFRIKQPAQAARVWTVARVEPMRFSWTSEERRLSFEAGHEVREVPGGAESRLSINLSGRWRVFMLPLMSPILGFALSRENAGLKAAAEARASRRD